MKITIAQISYFQCRPFTRLYLLLTDFFMENKTWGISEYSS